MKSHILPKSLSTKSPNQPQCLPHRDNRTKHIATFAFTLLALLTLALSQYTHTEPPLLTYATSEHITINPLQESTPSHISNTSHHHNSLQPTPLRFIATAPKDTRAYTPSAVALYQAIIPNSQISAHASSIIALPPLESNLDSTQLPTTHNTLPTSTPTRPAQTPTYMALFFAGSAEGARDVGIYRSVFYPQSPCPRNANTHDTKQANTTNQTITPQVQYTKPNTQAIKHDSANPQSTPHSTLCGAWSESKQILSAPLLSALSGTFIAKLGNPVGVVDGANRVHIFVVGVSLGGWATSRIYHLTLDSDLETLHFQNELHLSPFANLSYLVRAPAMPLRDGGFVLPIYHELARKYPLLAVFSKASTIANAKNRLDANKTNESTITKAQNTQPQNTQLQGTQSNKTQSQKISPHKLLSQTSSHTPLLHKPLQLISAKSNSLLQPSFVALDSTTSLGIYRNYHAKPMLTSLCLSPHHCITKPSNLINYGSSSVLFVAGEFVFLLHNLPSFSARPTRSTASVNTHKPHTLESANIESRLLEFDTPDFYALPHTRQQLWISVLARFGDTTSPMDSTNSTNPVSINSAHQAVLDTPEIDESSITTTIDSIDSATFYARDRAEFLPLLLLDSVELGEVSYPSVAVLDSAIHITYTYNRAHIKSALLDKAYLVHKARTALSISTPKQNRR